MIIFMEDDLHFCTGNKRTELTWTKGIERRQRVSQLVLLGPIYMCGWLESTSIKFLSGSFDFMIYTGNLFSKQLEVY